MSKFNFQMFLQAYNDSNYTNAPVKNNFRWTNNISGLDATNPQSEQFDLAPGESKAIVAGARTLTKDGTAEYSLSLKPNTTNSYVLKNTAGTAPGFRAARDTGADATTTVSVTVNGPLMTIASTAGTALDLIVGGVAVGDELRVGNPLNLGSQVFASSNRGKFIVLARTATSVTVKNEVAVAEAGIVLGSDFANQLQVYSSQGVQVGDTLVISGGFSSVSQNTYQVTDVTAEYVEFYYTQVLPTESDVQTDALNVYFTAKKFLYMEASQKCSLQVNGLASAGIEPFVVNNSTLPGVFAHSATIWSLVVTNNSTQTANLFVASIE